eukprot:TRINITY_DN2385_c0_g1_i4.p1 TRINITY_DN2385_c0_g1~~TRINITY_DN2385_c0_g1_i4.p1  ORF type:complete len:108 (+),score=3.99 TRINITY_DN2385_c0_g1_i4:124-447(+)
MKSSQLNFLIFWLSVSNQRYDELRAAISGQEKENVEYLIQHLIIFLVGVVALLIAGILYSMISFDRKIRKDIRQTKQFLRNIHPEIILENQRIRNFLLSRNFKNLNL